MRSWRQRVVCLIVVAALTGAPAALMACAVACAGHADHRAPSASHRDAMTAASDRHATGQRSHHHHAPEQPPAEHARHGLAPQASASRPCCPNCEMAPSVSVAAVRADAGAWLAAATAAVPAPFHPSLPRRNEVNHGRLAAAQSPPGTPLVLRI